MNTTNKTTKLFFKSILKLRTIIFVVLFVVLSFAAVNLKPALAIDGLMNGRLITSETDDFLLWLQTYNPTSTPYFTNQLFINKSGNIGVGTTVPTAKLHINPGATPGIINTGSTQISLLGSAGSVVVMADNTGTLYSTTTSSFINNNFYSSKIVVNPTSGVGWYRIASGNQVGGTVYIQAGIDNTGQTLEFNYTLRSYIGDSNSIGSINVLRSMNYNTGPITQIRIAANSTTGDYNAYLDIYVSHATSPVAFTVYGTNGASFLATPVYNPPATTYSQVVDLNNISLRGMATSQNLYVGNQARIGQQLLVDLAAHIKLTSSNETNEANRIMTGIMPIPSGSLATTTGQHLVYDFGDAGGVGLILASGYSSDAGGIKITNDGVAMWGAGDTDLLRVIDEDANAARFLINDSGNVGIGATLPIAKLDLPTGAFRSLAGTISGLGSAGNVVVMADNNGGLYSTSTSSFISSNSLDLWKGTKNGAIWNGDAGVGNVGIGTNNPTNRLTIFGGAVGQTNALISVRTAGSGAAGNAIEFGHPNQSGYISTLGANTNNGRPFLAFNAEAGTTQDTFRTRGIVGRVIRADLSGGVLFSRATNSSADNQALTDDVIINSAGNVGIGITNPTTLLHIYTSNATEHNLLTLQNTANWTTGQGHDIVWKDWNAITGAIGFTYSNGTADFRVHSQYNGGWTNSTTVNFVVKGNGNVGVGTTAPVSKFQVPTGVISGLGGAFTGLGSAGNVVVMADNNGGLYSTSTASFISANSLDLWEGAKNGAIWNGDAGVGNVGIGTTAPVGKLEVSSAADWLYITDTTAYATGVGGKLRFRGRQGSPDFADFAEIRGIKENANLNSAHGALVFMTNNDAAGEGWLPTERMRITSGGNVGIGTTAPSALLSVGNDNLFTVSSGGTVTAGLTSFRTSDQTNIATSASVADQNTLAFSPFGSYLWHDRLRFSTESGTPTFETYNGSWSADTLDTNLFAGKGGYNGQPIDGVTKTAARWTWNNGSFSYGQTYWWVIGIPYTATPSTKNFLIETSSDGVSWTTRHTSTGNTANSGQVVLYMPQVTTNYVRLTITVTNSQPLRVSTIQALSNRPGDQFVGPETEYPYTWDGSRNVRFSSNVGIGTTAPTARLDLPTGAFRSLAGTVSGLGSAGNVVVMADNNGGLYSTSTTSFISANSLDLWKGAKNGTIYNGDAGAGNVGIGLTNPNNKLQVYDLITFTDADWRTQIGYQAGKYDLGQFNTWIGYQAGSADNATGKTNAADYNTAIGYRTLYSNTTGYYNTANGYLALSLNTTGFANTATGWSALAANLTGTYNTAYGYNSLISNTDGSLNAAFGGASLRYNTSGYDNVAMGTDSLQGNTTGYRNSALGRHSGRYIAGGVTANATSTNSIYLGYSAMALASGDTNEIVIGASATGIGSNSVTLGNDSILTTALKGNVGIGTTNPIAKLHTARSLVSGAHYDTGSVLTVEDAESSLQIVSSDVGNDASALVLTNVVNSGDNRHWIFGARGATSGYRLDIGYKTSPASGYINTGLWTGMSILTNGNVGIGTTAPAAKLDLPTGAFRSLAGTVSGLGSAGNVLIMADNNGGLYATSTAGFGGSGTSLWGGTLNGTIYNGDAGAGNVGIGTTTPAYKLDISGTFKATASSSSIILDENGNISIGI